MRSTTQGLFCATLELETEELALGFYPAVLLGERRVAAQRMTAEVGSRAVKAQYYTVEGLKRQTAVSSWAGVLAGQCKEAVCGRRRALSPCNAE